ncbi:MAG: DUF4401 domain-containing protein [Myxococcota bacterium]
MHTADAPDVLAGPADRSSLQQLFQAGVLNPEARVAALRLALPPLHWWLWAKRLLMLLGAMFLLSGTVMFFAFNWAALHKFHKLGLIELGLALCLGGALLKGTAQLSGRLLLFASAVLVGVFLAVFGQIYQTGADAWELFAGWAALILPWVLLSRLMGLWIFWLLLLELAFTFWWMQTLRVEMREDALLLPCLLGLTNALALGLRELAQHPSRPWCTVTWPRPLLLSASLLLLFPGAVIAVVDDSPGDDAVLNLVALLGVCAVMGTYYIYRKPVLSLVSLCALALLGLVEAGLGRIWFKAWEGAWSVLFFGLVTVGIFYGALRFLHYVRKAVIPAQAGEATSVSPEAGMSEAASAQAGASHTQAGASHTHEEAETLPLPTLRSVLQLLQARGLVMASAIEQARLTLERLRGIPHPPWYLQVLAGVGAWIAATCFISFVGLLGLLNSDELSMLIFGVLFTAGGLRLRPDNPETFRRQLSLAITLAGKGLLLGFFAETVDEDFGVVLGSILLTTTLYPFSKDPIDRFVMSIVTYTILLIWLPREASRAVLLNPLMVLMLVGGGLCFTHPATPRALLPLGYATLLALLGTLVLPLLGELTVVPSQVWLSVALPISLVLLYGWAAGGLVQLKEEPLLWACIGTVLLSLLTTPAMLAGLGVLVLGYARSDRLLTGVGLIFLPCYLIFWYYHLGLTLLTKSYILGGSGALLLGLLMLAQSRPWAQQLQPLHRVGQEEVGQEEVAQEGATS